MPGADRAKEIPRTDTEDVDAELLETGAVNTGKADFQKNLRLRRRNIDIQKIDDLACSGCNLDGSLRAVQILRRAAQKNQSSLGAHLQMLSGKFHMQFAFNPVHRVLFHIGTGANLHFKELPSAT